MVVFGSFKPSFNKFLYKKNFGAISWRIKYKITKSKLPINFLGHKTINLVDTFHKFEEKLKKQQSPFFIYIMLWTYMIMKILIHSVLFFNKLLNYPKWFKFSRGH